LLSSGFCEDGEPVEGPKPGLSESAEEAAESTEEVREGATESGAQNAEDGEEEHEIPVPAVLIAVQTQKDSSLKASTSASIFGNPAKMRVTNSRS
jgi:hypothetical protein